MTIPNVPTDNLYKFCAIVGFLIIFVPPYFISKAQFDLNTRIVKLNGIQEEIKIKINSFNAIGSVKKNLFKSTILKKHLDLFAQKFKEGKVPYKKGEYLLKDSVLVPNVSDEDIILFSTLVKQIETLETEKQKTRTIVNEINYYQSQLNYYAISWLSSFSLGIILLIVGFFLWYKKVQMPQDKQLIVGVDQLEKSTNSKKRKKFPKGSKSNNSKG